MKCTKRMSSYVMTPIKDLTVTVANAASQRGIKRKVEFTPKKDLTVTVANAASQRGIKRKVEFTPMKELPVTVANAASQVGVKRKMEFNLTPVDLRQRVKYRREDPYEMPENLDPNVFLARCSTITEAIMYNLQKIVLAWCPSSVVTGDFLSTLVHKYGEITDLRDRWLPSASCHNKMEWGGMTIFYEEEADAIKAAKDLPLRSKYVKTISMQEIINHIAKIEAGHPTYGRGYTNVIIQTDCRLDETSKGELEKLLRQCGEVLLVKYIQNVCIVQFRFFAHAHLASVVLNEDEDYDNITAIVENSVKKDYILDLLKENVMLHLEDCFSTQ